MRRREPGDREKRLVAVFVFAQERNRFVNCDVGSLALDLFHLAVAAEVRVVIEEIQADTPLVEAAAARADWTLCLCRPDVPLAEHAGDVTGRFQFLGNRRLLRTHVAAVVCDLDAKRMPPGQHTAPRRRANRRGGIESIKDKARAGHGIEVWRLNDRMPVVAGVAPTLIVRHDEHDVRSGGRTDHGGCEKGE